VSSDTASRASAVQRRREREQNILRATRELFDAKGVRDAQIEDIAKAVGVNRTIIYRHFASKDELFGFTLVGYLTELDGELAAADPGSPAADGEPADPTARLQALAEVLVSFCLRYPAFADCALALLRRPGPELLEELSDAALHTLGRTLAKTMGRIAAVLREGMASGAFRDEDPDLLANLLYTQVLGSVHLARAQCIVGSAPPPADVFTSVSQEQVHSAVVRAVLATAQPAG
jgi:AcrR family transcriptional regulator